MSLNNAPEKDQPWRLAFSDGMADEFAYPSLAARPVAIIPFTFVANEKVPVDTLSLGQVRAIFTGKVSHWSEITGNPKDTAEIHVIGRTSSSGTRRAMERYVLGALGTQAPVTSDSCLDPRPGQKVLALVCEKQTTLELVNKVAAVDSAIGYADVSDVNRITGVKHVRLDGRDATLNDIRAGYPFWTVEYIYSYGSLKGGSLAAAFADYLSSREGSDIIASFQYYSCRHDGLDVADLCNSGR
jgi:phosphate transport system substrate-binding protein